MQRRMHTKRTKKRLRRFHLAFKTLNIIKIKKINAKTTYNKNKNKVPFGEGAYGMENVFTTTATTTTKNNINERKIKLIY